MLATGRRELRWKAISLNSFSYFSNSSTLRIYYLSTTYEVVVVVVAGGPKAHEASSFNI